MQAAKNMAGMLKLSLYTLPLLHKSGDYSIIDGYSSYYLLPTHRLSPLLDFAFLGHCIANSSYKWTMVLGDVGQYMQFTNRVAMLVQILNNNSNPNYTID